MHIRLVEQADSPVAAVRPGAARVPGAGTSWRPAVEVWLNTAIPGGAQRPGHPGRRGDVLQRRHRVGGRGVRSRRGGRLAAAARPGRAHPDPARPAGARPDRIFAWGHRADRDLSPAAARESVWLLQAGRHAARQIRRLGEPLAFRSTTTSGIMATIGRRSAVVEPPWRIRTGGTLARAAWLALHLLALQLGNRNRLSAVLNPVLALIWTGATAADYRRRRSRAVPRTGRQCW